MHIVFDKNRFLGTLLIFTVYDNWVHGYLLSFGRIPAWMHLGSYDRIYYIIFSQVAIDSYFKDNIPHINLVLCKIELIINWNLSNDSYALILTHASSPTLRCVIGHIDTEAGSYISAYQVMEPPHAILRQTWETPNNH